MNAVTQRALPQTSESSAEPSSSSIPLLSSFLLLFADSTYVTQNRLSFAQRPPRHKIFLQERKCSLFSPLHLPHSASHLKTLKAYISDNVTGFLRSDLDSLQQRYDQGAKDFE